MFLACTHTCSSQIVLSSGDGPTSLPVDKLINVHALLSGYVELSQPASSGDIRTLLKYTPEANKQVLDTLLASHAELIMSVRLSVLDTPQGHHHPLPGLPPATPFDACSAVLHLLLAAVQRPARHPHHLRRERAGTGGLRTGLPRRRLFLPRRPARWRPRCHQRAPVQRALPPPRELGRARGDVRGGQRACADAGLHPGARGAAQDRAPDGPDGAVLRLPVARGRLPVQRLGPQGVGGARRRSDPAGILDEDGGASMCKSECPSTHLRVESISNHVAVGCSPTKLS
jgi:hypothetical protein